MNVRLNFEEQEDIGKPSKHTHKSATKYGYSGEKVELSKLHVRGDSKTGDNLAVQS